MKFLPYFLLRCFKHRRRYHEKLLKSQALLERELDLKRFIKLQRFHTTALLGLLTGHQNFYASKVSKLSIDQDASHSESKSAYSSCSDGDKKTYKTQFIDRVAKKFINSEDPVDKRLLELLYHDGQIKRKKRSSLSKLINYLGIKEKLMSSVSAPAASSTSLKLFQHIGKQVSSLPEQRDRPDQVHVL